jgi:hypothetical protein
MSRARSLRSPYALRRRLVAVMAILVPCLTSALAVAQEAVVSAEVPTVVGTARERAIERETVARVELGYRGSFVTNAGYNPFSSNDYLPQFSLLVSRTVYVAHPFAFATGLAWDYAGGGDFARGSPSALTLGRVTVPLEGRLHFGDWGYAFARVSPGVAFVRAEIDDPSAPAPLAKERWLFATDVSAGYAFPLLPRRAASTRTARAWLQADGGYGWVANERLDLTPGGGASGVDLGTLALNGAFFRIAVAASY